MTDTVSAGLDAPPPYSARSRRALPSHRRAATSCPRILHAPGVRTPSACAVEAGSVSASSRVLGAQSQVGSCAAAGRLNFERCRLHSIGAATSLRRVRRRCLTLRSTCSCTTWRWHLRVRGELPLAHPLGHVEQRAKNMEAARRGTPIRCRSPRPFRRHQLTALRADAQCRLFSGAASEVVE